MSRGATDEADWADQADRTRVEAGEECRSVALQTTYPSLHAVILPLIQALSVSSARSASSVAPSTLMPALFKWIRGVANGFRDDV